MIDVVCDLVCMIVVNGLFVVVVLKVLICNFWIWVDDELFVW